MRGARIPQPGQRPGGGGRWPEYRKKAKKFPLGYPRGNQDGEGLFFGFDDRYRPSEYGTWEQEEGSLTQGGRLAAPVKSKVSSREARLVSSPR